ncbi:hypothetical protein NUC16_004419 [Salmonella enterica]|nr:hypothetical protein [Salmonella enterica]EJJ1403696.1 hypothetical protein [Salmonella enterica]EJP5297959.1 hypothetical protein [Salmonella enterica]
MADMRQVVFRQAGHFHYDTAVNTILEHGSGNFLFAFVATCLAGCLSVRAVVRWS